MTDKDEGKRPLRLFASGGVIRRLPWGGARVGETVTDHVIPKAAKPLSGVLDPRVRTGDPQGPSVTIDLRYERLALDPDQVGLKVRKAVDDIASALEATAIAARRDMNDKMHDGPTIEGTCKEVESDDGQG